MLKDQNHGGEDGGLPEMYLMNIIGKFCNYEYSTLVFVPSLLSKVQ
jgi:hypothetical protein